jgi:glucan phosphoethanolaminetransferase (alkaline phosphatase superfamily)
MSQTTRQTETSNIHRDSTTGRRIVGVIFGLIEIILAMRLIFKLLGANPSNGFIKIIYGITHLFTALFEGIFAEITISSSTKAVFEPATLIAIILVALIAWLVLKLMTPQISNHVETTEYTNRPSSDYTNRPRNEEQPRLDNQQNPVNQQYPPNQQNPANQQNPVNQQSSANQQNPDNQQDIQQ